MTNKIRIGFVLMLLFSFLGCAALGYNFFGFALPKKEYISNGHLQKEVVINAANSSKDIYEFINKTYDYDPSKAKMHNIQG